MTDEPVLEVRNLRTEFETDDGTVEAVADVSYMIDHGETHGFVGESGAGKTVTGLSVIGLVDAPGRIVSGEILFKGTDLRSLDAEALRQLRGNEIAMIFQDPMSALNPSYTIGTQLVDTIREHTDRSKSDARSHAISLLEDVGIPDAPSRIDDYPHQFSGGMRQRVIIALALSCDPSLLIADEPTTALDVTIQAEILDLLSELQREYDVAIQLITHNMGVVAQMCDTVSVMYAGEVVERGPVERIFESPTHPYTVGLLKAIPRIGDPRTRLDTIPGSMPDLIETPSGCSYRDRCPHATDECAEVDVELEAVSTSVGQSTACIRHDELELETSIGDGRGEDAGSEERPRPSDAGDRPPATPSDEVLLSADNLRRYFTPESESWLDSVLGRRKYVHAVDDVSFSIFKGETLGLVGESGCGKTTLGRTITRLYEPTGGTIVFSGVDLTEKSRREMQRYRSDLQMIFQDPFSSLNPRAKVLDIVGRPLEIHGLVDSKAEKRERVVELLAEVGMNESHVERYPHEFSGGQKQRIGIARALAVEPDFIVCDEPVSALDVSVQAKILNLFMDLQERHGLTYLFIAHDLNVVQHIADRIAVMYLGEIVEMGTTEDLFTPPYHPYTEVLLSSIPQPRVDTTIDRIALEGDLPSPIDPPSGCRFRTRCLYATDACADRSPSLRTVDGRTEIACHLFDPESDVTDDDVETNQRSRFTAFRADRSTVEREGPPR